MKGPEPPALPTPPPPPPGFPPPAPAPPGKVETLAANSGFAVYEPGSSVFDESLLVYLARPRNQWPDFDIYNHGGRVLGASRSKRCSPLTQAKAATTYFDPRMNQFLRVELRTAPFRTAFEVSGVANVEVVTSMRRLGDLIIQRNNEPYGVIDSPPLLGMSAPSVKILDLHENQVGTIKVVKAGGLFNQTENYVVSIEPGLRGELRRAVIAVPTMMAVMRRSRQ